MDRQVIDQTIVRELKDLSSGAESSFFLDQVLLFSRRGRQSLTALDGALSSGERAAAGRAAHALAGSAAVIGAARLSELCLDLEERQARWDDLTLQRSVQAIHREFAEAERLLAGEASDVFITVDRG